MTDTIFVIHGPNLNLLGSHDPRVFGNQTLAEIDAMLEQRAKALKFKLDIRQSNHEGVLVDWINEALAKASAVIINGGAYAHTSIAIRDALAAVQVPVIEVHMANVFQREHFRRQSMIAQVAKGCIVGFGAMSYVLALDAAAQLCKGAGAAPQRGQIQ